MESTPKENGPARGWIAILGRKDEPVDGVVDYCTFLGRALKERGVRLEPYRVGWHEQGWLVALRQLWREAKAWRGRWVLLQYTALGWSRRGFPFGALAVVAILRRKGARCGIVFHDPYRQFGTRRIDRLRGACQDWIVRKIYRQAAKGVFPDPLEKIAWLAKDEDKAVFVPIGANVPERSAPLATRNSDSVEHAVAVFCLSGMPALRDELQDISDAAGAAASRGAKFRIIFLGRGTAEAAEKIAHAFRDIPVEVLVLGLMSAEKISDTLAQSDAMLCVRGRLYPRRGSAIAGIACGLPIIGYAGAAEGTPMAEAGVILAPYRDGHALGEALARVLEDRDLRLKLRQKSVNAQQSYFSWDVIANSYAELLAESRP